MLSVINTFLSRHKILLGFLAVILFVILLFFFMFKEDLLIKSCIPKFYLSDRELNQCKKTYNKHFPDEFRNTTISGSAFDLSIPGDTKEAFVAAGADSIKYAEADFMLSSDHILASIHNKNIGRKCAPINQKSFVELQKCAFEDKWHLATLVEFLRQPFREVYIDLKDTLSSDSVLALKSVDVAIKSIKQTGRENSAIIMVYNITPEIINLIQKNHIRAGIKGYPCSKKETMTLVKIAACYDFELVCVPLSQVSAKIIKDSANMGIWHLDWYIDKSNIFLWRSLIKEGLGGIISPYYHLIEEQASPYWRSL